MIIAERFFANPQMRDTALCQSDCSLCIPLVLCAQLVFLTQITPSLPATH